MPEEQPIGSLVAEIPFDVDEEKAKPRLTSIMFFDYSNTTLEHKVNLVGIFDRLFVDRETQKTVPIGVFVRTAETLDSPVFVHVVAPDKTAVAGFSVLTRRSDVLEAIEKGALRKESKFITTQFIGRIAFEAPVEGTYWFAVSFNNALLGGTPLVVEYRDFKELNDGISRGDG